MNETSALQGLIEPQSAPKCQLCDRARDLNRIGVCYQCDAHRSRVRCPLVLRLLGKDDRELVARGLRHHRLMFCQLVDEVEWTLDLQRAENRGQDLADAFESAVSWSGHGVELLSFPGRRQRLVTPGGF